MSARRPTTTQTTRLQATCSDCGWTCEAHNGLGAAARHHDASGHRITVEVDRTIVYGDETTYADPDQTNLLDALQDLEEGTA